MAWEKRGSKTYFYRSVRWNGRVQKVYYGAGPAGQFAASVVALRRAKKDAAKQECRQARDLLNAALLLGSVRSNMPASPDPTTVPAPAPPPSECPLRIYDPGRETE
jgi:hypothetical protein